jgi:hypothetical protein
MLNVALTPILATTARAPARFKIFYTIQGETARPAREVARVDTIGKVLAAIALKRPELASFSGLDGTVEVLLEERGTWRAAEEKAEEPAASPAGPAKKRLHRSQRSSQ